MDLPTPDWPRSTEGRTGRQAGSQLVEALAAHGGQDEHVDPGRRPGNVGRHQIGVGGKVGLGQDDERLGSALPGQGDQAFEPSQVRGRRQRHHQSHEVDVGRQQLLRGPSGGLGTSNGRTSRQQRGAWAVGRVVDAEPVPRRRIRRSGGSDDLLPGLAQDDVGAPLGTQHPTGPGAVRQRCSPGVVPAQILECHHAG